MAKPAITAAVAPATANRMLDAMRVIQLTPHIRAYLQQHDPKALEQLEAAIDAAKAADATRGTGDTA
jgi:hypothetical protein